MLPHERIVLAVDTADAAQAVSLVRKMSGHVGVFKLGLELVTAVGPSIFDDVRAAGAARIFYDAKLFDIPNTVRGAMNAVIASRAWCVTVHACGGTPILRAATEASSGAGSNRPLVLAVTLLTSISPETLSDELGISEGPQAYVRRLAALAAASGCDGVICSPHEIAGVRAVCPNPDFLVVTPGVRPAGGNADDQSRVMTPAEAIRLGASMLVIGRPITGASDPVAAAARIAEEIAAA